MRIHHSLDDDFSGRRDKKIDGFALDYVQGFFSDAADGHNRHFRRIDDGGKAFQADIAQIG